MVVPAELVIAVIRPAVSRVKAIPSPAVDVTPEADTVILFPLVSVASISPVARLIR